ncbi:hypothetical protein HDV63DRAFT_370169 [Trichoderma sp. SZMC 28014]
MNLSNSANFAYLATITLLTVFTYRWIVRQSKVKFKGEKNRAIKKSTFRITGIPIDWDHSQLQSFLENQETITSASIESLALEDHGGPQVATATFEGLLRQNDRSWSILMPASSNNRKQYLAIDEDFHGMTALYTPPLQDHKIDIIALSGLGGHAFGSFKERGGSYMWLRDSLPFDLTLDTSDQPIARVMIYGYDSVVAESKSMQNIEDLATGFIGGLQKLANASIIQPIILIGHSLGGLIIKQALISLSRSEKEDDRNLVRAIYGVVFFGTPHDGMDITSLISMTGDSSPNRSLIESLSRNNSQVLTAQQRDFHKALGDKGNSEVFSFYETLESPTAQQDRYGNWKMTGPTTVLVTKSSATHCRPWEDGAEHICAINRTHSEMVKFGPHDADYKNVRERLSGLCRRAFASRDRLQTSRSLFLVPYSQNTNFVARAEPLSEIKKQFGLDQREGSTQPRRRVSLCGLGGVGKTQIAIAYAYWLQKASPDISVFWVHASNIDRFRQSYASIAKKCNIPGHDNPKANMLMLVSNWLEQQTMMRWLMIIDNADDVDIFCPNQLPLDGPGDGSQATAALTSGHLVRYIPDCNHGSVLITTRDKIAGIRLCQGLPPIKIRKMTDDEAYQLVQRIISTQQISMAETVRLLSKLEHLPLALAQAASFIQENDISIDDYVQLLDESDSTFVNQLSESFETVGRDSETPHAVTATWMISFEQIRRKDALISDILSFLSFFHFQAIPRVFVEHYYWQRCEEQTKGDSPAKPVLIAAPGTRTVRVSSYAGIEHIESVSPTPAVLVKALGTLKAFSFISEGENKSLAMHRLVQLVTQKWIINESQVAKFAGIAMKTMSKSYSIALRSRELCMRFLPHANSVLEKTTVGLQNDTNMAMAILLYYMARYFFSKGDWKKSSDLTTQAIQIQKTVMGEEHPDTLTTMLHLAATYGEQGRSEEAEDLVVHVREISTAVLGEEYPTTLECMAHLATIYKRQGRLKEAEKLSTDLLEIRKRISGEDHADTLGVMNGLASLYLALSRFKEAENLLLYATEACKRTLGESHRQTIGCMANLASVFGGQGQWNEAEDLQMHLREICMRELGDEDPNTLNVLISLIRTYRHQSRWGESEDLAVEVLKKCKRILGEAHETTLSVFLSLAETYKAQGRWMETENLVVEALKMSKKGLEDEHPMVAACMSMLLPIYQHQHRWKEAEDLQVQLIQRLERMVGEEHSWTLFLLYNLGERYTQQGRWREAEALQMRITGIRKRVQGE